MMMGAPGPDGAAGTPPAIEIRGLVKDFAVGLRGLRLRAVDHVSFAVRPGEIFGLQPHAAVGQILHVTRHFVLLSDLPRGETEADALHVAAEDDGGVVDLCHERAPYARSQRVQPPISPDF